MPQAKVTDNSPSVSLLDLYIITYKGFCGQGANARAGREDESIGR